MNDDLLQERLARLENGEPLDTALADLAPDEVRLVRTAAALRALPHPARAAGAVNAQRAGLLNAAQRGQTRPSLNSSKRWLWGGLAVAGAAAFLFLCALAVLGGGVLWLWSTSDGGVAQNPFSPIGSAPTQMAYEAPDPQTAALKEAHGMVEVQTEDGAWKPARAGETIAAGQRVRTGSLSSATLAFYDGSQSRLGPETEVSLDALDAQRAGARTVLLTQWVGDTENDVAHSDDPASRYEVATPSGTGAAKGTAFHVRVTIDSLVFFNVNEGSVAVTNVNITVIVVAGQSTVITLGQPPAPPMFRFSGEGEVQAIEGSAWRVAGQTLSTDSNTVITGDPQAGDWVSFEGRLLADGARYADRITLLRRAVTNTFTFIGTVEAISDTAWTISGRLVRVTEETEIEAGLAVSDTVEVTGLIGADGAFVAERIARFDPASPSIPFQFTGVVQNIGDTVWTVSGITVTVTPSTTIEAGITLSDEVRVTGLLLPDGTRVASSIALADESAHPFTFAGVVQSMDPWIVAGVPISTSAQTEIDDDIVLSDMVKVSGQILPDGTWLAGKIDRFDDERRWRVDFVGRVASVEPWVIGGVTITTDARTKIKGNPQAGDLARVKGDVLPNGAWLAREIRRIGEPRGCVANTVIVVQINGNQLTLSDGQVITLDPSITVTGNLQVASVIVVQSCLRDDGQANELVIIVIFQLGELPPIPTPAPGTPTPTPVSGCAQLVVISNGQVSLPNGRIIQMDGDTWLEIKSSKKGDKIEIKLNGHKAGLEIKIKGKKDAVIEIKGRKDFIVQGAGKYKLGGVVTISACNTSAGLVVVVTGGAVPAAPPDSNLCINPAGKMMPCPPGNPPPFRPVDEGDN